MVEFTPKFITLTDGDEVALRSGVGSPGDAVNVDDYNAAQAIRVVDGWILPAVLLDNQAFSSLWPVLEALPQLPVDQIAFLPDAT